MLLRSFAQRGGRYSAFLVNGCFLTRSSRVILELERTTYDYGNDTPTHVQRQADRHG